MICKYLCRYSTLSNACSIFSPTYPATFYHQFAYCAEAFGMKILTCTKLSLGFNPSFLLAKRTCRFVRIPVLSLTAENNM